MYKNHFILTDIHSAKEVYWEDQSSVKYGRQEFNGVPFVVIDNKRFDCQFGTDRKKRSKEEGKRYKVNLIMFFLFVMEYRYFL